MLSVHVTGAQQLKRAAAFAALAALATLTLWPDSASAARVRCPGTFRVLHDDSIGRLELPRGNYRITILASGRPSCRQASRLFTRFLDDFDGVLPRPWRISVANSAFVRSRGVGFNVKRTGRSGGGGSNGGEGSGRANAYFCPGSFRVLHDDHIGALRVPAGRYNLVLLQRRGLTCAQASRLFTRFLDSVSGRLPRPWRVRPQTASFVRRTNGVGFRLEPFG
jgi:hypothetical protein